MVWIVAGFLGCLLKDDGIETCALVCDTLYQESACAIERPGRTTAELLDFCNTECIEAWAVDCDGGREDDCLGGYDPYDNLHSGSAVALLNHAQAELWADCVQELTCDDLQDGYCAPIW